MPEALTCLTNCHVTNTLDHEREKHAVNVAANDVRLTEMLSWDSLPDRQK
jgi:hypothetical protein